MTTTCGGCNNLGAHVRWCPEVVGYLASTLGPLSERIEGAGDTIGSNDMALANRLYATASELGKYARVAATQHETDHLTAATTAAFEATTPRTTEREARA